MSKSIYIFLLLIPMFFGIRSADFAEQAAATGNEADSIKIKSIVVEYIKGWADVPPIFIQDSTVVDTLINETVYED